MENRNESIDNQHNNRLEGWSNEERFNLLQALQKHGSQDVAKLHNYVPTKSQDEIKMALEFYLRRSASLPVKERKKRIVNHAPIKALNSWGALLLDSHSPDELQTDIAIALRLIAEFEDIPPAECTENLDFKKMYLMIADAVDGKDLEDDNLIKTMIDKCVTDTALTSEFSMKNAKFKELLSSISLTGVVNSFPRPSDEKDLLHLRPILSEKNYNPLNVSAENCNLLG